MESAGSPSIGSAASLDDSRAHPRSARQSGLRIRRLGSEKWEYDALCTDCSGGGIGADVAAVFKVGEVVELSLGEEGGVRYCVARVVYRINGTHYGLCFLK